MAEWHASIFTLVMPTHRTIYDVRLAAGTITAGGTLGILIPPSIMLVVMGPVLELPVTDLFAAAIVPGIMLAAMYTLYALGRCWLNPSLGPKLAMEDRAESMGHLWYEFFMGLVPRPPWSCLPWATSCSVSLPHPKARHVGPWVLCC